MKKQQILKAYRKSEMEWKSLTPKEKSKKIREHIYVLLENEDKDDETRRGLQQQLIILEELESEELENYLDMLNETIMENCKENIEKNYK